MARSNLNSPEKENQAATELESANSAAGTSAPESHANGHPGDEQPRDDQQASPMHEGDNRAAPPSASTPAPSALPDPLETVMERVPRLEWTIRFAWRLGERWGYDQCSLIAAAMAFFGLLSVFPVVLAVIAIVARTLAGNQQVITSFQSYIQQFFPGAAGREIAGQITTFVERVMQGPDSSSISIVAILSLLWSGRAFFDTLAWQLNGIWPHATPRTFWQHQAALWGTFLGAGLLWVLSTGVTLALSAVRSLNAKFLMQYLPGLVVSRESAIWDFITRAVSWILTVFMFWMMYRFLPNVQTRQRRRIAFGAALIAAGAWEIAEIAFTRFLGNLTKYEFSYGSVAGVVLILMWMYFSSLIILLGAEAAAAFEDTCAISRDDTQPGLCATTANK